MGTGEVPPGVLAATASSLAQLEFALGTTESRGHDVEVVERGHG